jgi:hypothetical protein
MDVVSLEQVREQLRFADTYTDDDDMLENIYIPAANEVVRRECGDIIPQTYDEFYCGGTPSIKLRHSPILRVLLVEEDRGFVIDRLVEQPPTTTEIGTYYAFSIDYPKSGIITRRGPNNNAFPFWPVNGECVHVIYVAGKADVPGNVVMVALQIIAYWYRAFEQQQTGTDPYAALNDDFPESGDNIATPAQYGVPAYLLELLRASAREPVIG